MKASPDRASPSVGRRRTRGSLQAESGLASHALSLAALRRAGYRSTNRYLVFQALPHTLGVGPEVWRVLAKCHDVRNRGEYEGDLYVDERLVADLIHTCKLIAAALDKLPPI